MRSARVRVAIRFDEPSSTEMYFAKPVPNTLRWAHAERPYSYGWRIRFGLARYSLRATKVVSGITGARRWAKSYDLSRSRSWSGPASFAKPAPITNASSRPPIMPANGRSRRNEQRVRRRPTPPSQLSPPAPAPSRACRDRAGCRARRALPGPASSA